MKANYNSAENGEGMSIAQARTAATRLLADSGLSHRKYLIEFIAQVFSLGYTQKPNYDRLLTLLTEGKRVESASPPRASGVSAGRDLKSPKKAKRKSINDKGEEEGEEGGVQNVLLKSKSSAKGKRFADATAALALDQRKSGKKARTIESEDEVEEADEQGTLPQPKSKARARTAEKHRAAPARKSPRSQRAPKAIASDEEMQPTSSQAKAKLASGSKHHAVDVPDFVLKLPVPQYTSLCSKSDIPDTASAARRSGQTLPSMNKTTVRVPQGTKGFTSVSGINTIHIDTPATASAAATSFTPFKHIKGGSQSLVGPIYIYVYIYIQPWVLESINSTCTLSPFKCISPRSYPHYSRLPLSSSLFHLLSF